MSQRSYSEKFAAIEEYLKSGDCYQINLAQRFSAHYQGSPWAAYVKLTQANKAPFSSFINHPQGAILSISPERFIAVHDNKVETKPIKGTLPRKAVGIIICSTALVLLVDLALENKFKFIDDWFKPTVNKSGRIIAYYLSLTAIFVLILLFVLFKLGVI